MGDSMTSSLGSEPRMLERRVSNQRADLSNDQQMNYLLAWFQHWSDLQKEDFVVTLAETVSSKLAAASADHVNGLVNGVADMNCSGKRKPPSLFSCQVQLFRGWVASWSDDQKNYLILRLKDIDGNFAKKYEHYLEYGKDSPEKDYFEPGIPPELDLSIDKSSSHNTSYEEEGVNLPDEDRLRPSDDHDEYKDDDPEDNYDDEEEEEEGIKRQALSPIDEGADLES